MWNKIFPRSPNPKSEFERITHIEIKISSDNFQIPYIYIYIILNILDFDLSPLLPRPSNFVQKLDQLFP